MRKGANMIGMFTPRLVVAVLALFAAIAQNPATAQEQRATAGASFIHYHDGRLSAQIDSRPLVDVLRELGAATGARFILRDTGNGQVLVSVTIASQPFVEGVKRILRGCSYAIYTREGADLPTVLVLSAGQTTGAPVVRAAPMFPPPTVSSPLATGQREADQVEAQAQEQAEREETLNQALTALNPAEGTLSQHALDQLVGIRDDPRATQALVQVALGASESDARAQATEALWHHAADLEFADADAVSALEQLANDADTVVQKIAQQALADMQQYRQRNPAP
jgi:hypothetical protein